MKKMIDTISVTKIEDFIKTLNKDELVYLNRLVVQRVKLLNQLEATNKMTEFNLGDYVHFSDQRGTVISGKIIKMNRKTLSVLTDDSIQWNVHPSLLHRK